jgi:hypothetical protein
MDKKAEELGWLGLWMLVVIGLAVAVALFIPRML